MSFFIQSKLGDLVIDIYEALTTPGTALDVWPEKTTSPDWDNQLWEFVNSSISGYYYLQNPSTGLVIDIQKDKTAPPAPLDAFTMKTSSPGNENQLWAFFQDTATGYYFIQSLLDGSVIDVQGAITTPGTLLDAFPEKTSYPSNDNQLWTFVGTNGESVTPPPPPPPPLKFATVL